MKTNIENQRARKPLKVYFYGMNRSEIKPYEKYVQKIEEGRVGKAAGLDAKRAGDNHNTVLTMRDNRGNRLVFIRFQVDREPRLMFIRMMDHKGYNQELFSNQGLKHFMTLHAPQWTDWVHSQDELELEELTESETCSSIDIIEIDWERVDWLGDELIFLDVEHEKVVELPMNAKAMICAAAGVGKTTRSLELLEQFCNNAPQLQKPFLFLCESLKLKQAAQELWLAKGGSLERVHFKTMNELLQEHIEDCHLVGEEDFQLWLQGYIERYKKQKKKPEVIQVEDRLLDKPRELYAEMKRIAGLSEPQYKDLGNKECYFHENNEKAWIFKACCDYKNTLHPLKERPELKIWLGDWIAQYRMATKKKTAGTRLSEAFLKNTVSIVQECNKAMMQGFAEYQTKPSKLSMEEKKWILDTCTHYKHNKVHPAFYDPALKQRLKDRYTCVVIDEAQRCSMNQLELVAAIAEQGCFYLMDTNQITNANASIHDALRKWLKEHFPEQCHTIELSPSCRRCHPLILDCFLNPVLKTKGQHCGVDYKGKYSQVIAANRSEDTENIFSRIEFLDDTSLKSLQAMTASCSFAVIVANEEAWRQAVTLFGEACVYKTHEVGGLEFDQVLLFDCFNQPGLASLAKLLQECQSKEEFQARAMESNLFHRAAPGMEGREDIVLFLNNLYLAASRAKKGLHIYQPPSRACDMVMKGLQANGMPKETRPVFVKLEASTKEEWHKHRGRLIKEGKIEKAWSISQTVFDMCRKDFDALCVQIRLEEDAKAEQKPVAAAPVQHNTQLVAQEPRPQKSVKIPEPEKRQKAEQTKLQSSAAFAGKRKPQAAPTNQERVPVKQTPAPKAPNLIEDVLNKKDFSINPYGCLYEKEHQGLSLLDLIHQQKDKDILLRRCYEKVSKHVSGTRKEKEIERVHLAVLCGQLAELKKCLTGNLANELGKHLVSPLYIAAQYNYLDLASHLILKGGAKINAQQPAKSKDTALHVAAEKGHLKMVELLLKQGADENQTNQQGQTPVLLVEVSKNSALINLFKEHASKKAPNGTHAAKKSSAVKYPALPSSLKQLRDALEQKKISFDSLKNNGVLIEHLKINNMLPTEKDLNSFYANNESGWFHILYYAKEHVNTLLQALMAVGICPNAKTLAGCHVSDNVNTWNWLARYNECIPIFKTLLERGIVPAAKDLSVCRTTDNTNSWYCLAGDNEYIPVFQALLEKGILPDAKDLNVCCTACNTNTWFWLTNNKERIHVFKSLLEKGVLPDAKDLRVCRTSDNLNSWSWLTSSNGRIPAFKSLLEKGVFPDAKDLSVCFIADNSNSWHFLATNNERAPIFMALLEKGIVPDAKDLGVYRTTDNTNAWFWLAKNKERVQVFKSLLEKGIVPDAKDLSVCCTTDNTNSWMWLANDKACMPVFEALLERGIAPDAKDLSVCCANNNANAWFCFAVENERMPIFKLLLEKGIAPDAKDLSICRTDDNTHAWYWLASTSNGLAVFSNLLTQNIVPDASSLEEPKDVWSILLQTDAGIEIVERLLDSGRAPQKEMTLKTMLEAIQSKQAEVEHPLINKLHQLLAHFKKEDIDVNALISLSVFNQKNDNEDKCRLNPAPRCMTDGPVCESMEIH